MSNFRPGSGAAPYTGIEAAQAMVWKVARGATHFRRFVAVMQQETSRGTCPIGLLPATFDAEYVAGAVAPFLLSSTYVGETPSLPMIDLALSKEKAVPPQLWGLLYDDWAPNPEEEGVTVFMQGYENRGPNNERKKIYVSAVTPDLIATKYRPKLVRFYEQLFADSNAGRPFMGC